MRNGFIVLYRKILDWRWFKFPFHLQTFIYLLEMANWRDTQYGNTTLLRGQLITTIRTIKDDIGCSIDTIYKVLKDLEETGEIKRVSDANGTLITIVNFDEYQDVRVLPRRTKTERNAEQKPNAEQNKNRTQSRIQTEHKAEHEPNAEQNHINNINKDNNNNKDNKEEEKVNSTTTTQSKNDFFKNIKSENVAEYLKAQNELWRENMMVSLHIGKNDSLLDRLINSFQQELISTGAVEKEENDLRRHFLSYARKALKNDDAFKTAKVERMADASAYGIAEKDYNDNWN